MATLHEKKVQFNSKLTISNKGGNQSTDSGLILVKEFMESLNFSGLSKQYLAIEDKRLYHTYDNFFFDGIVDLSKYSRLFDRFLRKPIEARPYFQGDFV